MLFTELHNLGYGSELLPIVPPDAKISSHSRAAAEIASGAGKIPGKRVSDGWVGFAEWSKFSAMPTNLTLWDTWGAGVGIQTRNFPAVDIDTDNPELAAKIADAVESVLGCAPRRAGRPGRLLLPFRAAKNFSPPKRVLAWFDGGAKQAVEFLGSGQQFVAFGLHPKTRTLYRWDQPLPAAADLPEVTEETWSSVIDAIAMVIELAGFEIIESGARGQAVDIGQDALRAPSLSAIEAALAAVPNGPGRHDYDTWIKVGVAVKAAGGEEALDAWIKWSTQHPDTSAETALYKWNSFHPPFSTGWPWLSQWASTQNHNAFNVASYDFAEVSSDADPEAASWENVFSRYVWIAGVERIGDTWTRETLSKTQFNVRNNGLGDPTSSTKSAYAIFLRDHKRLTQVDSITYRPGMPLFVEEVTGRCLNLWRPSTANIPNAATDDEVENWLKHLRFMYPKEADTICDWLAALLQQPEIKPNWHLVLCSTWQGLGKDLTLRPVIRALGEHNVRITTPDQILGSYTDWAKGRKLIVVEEMQTYGRRELENRLKPYLASPPEMVPISEKYVALFEVPNIMAMVFLTNHDNAIPMSKQDRRYFVAWSECRPKSAAYYAKMVEWQEGGGAALVARWLLSRDISKFDARGIAPMSEGKATMQAQTLSPLETWIEEGMLYGDGAFSCDLVDLADLYTRIPRAADWKSATPERLGSLLRRAGATKLGRVRLPEVLGNTGSMRANLYALRRGEIYAGLERVDLARLFLKQRAEFEARDAGRLGVDESVTYG